MTNRLASMNSRVSGDVPFIAGEYFIRPECFAFFQRQYLDECQR